MRLAHILQRQRYRLHLRFVALCQAISLEPPYYTKIDIQVTPINYQVPNYIRNSRAKQTKHLIDGGGAGSRTPVFPPLLLIVNN